MILHLPQSSAYAHAFAEKRCGEVKSPAQRRAFIFSIFLLTHGTSGTLAPATRVFLTCFIALVHMLAPFGETILKVVDNYLTSAQLQTTTKKLKQKN
ncbi:MAG: hypothetical protein KF746_27140 [Chitinophagaceae bacterium]|nr:hypothetical protein [Chitinophagaceae bacterium]